MSQHFMHRVVLALILIISPTLPAPSMLAGAEVQIDRLELISRMQSGGAAPTLLSRADLDFIVASGTPFSADAGIRLEYDEGDGVFYENLSAGDPRLGLRFARLRVFEPAGATLDLAYYVGETDRFGSGAEFPRRFGTAEFASRYRGYIYFPTGPDYDGLHGVDGTGVSISSASLWTNADLILYAYQDAARGPERYATDVRYRLNRPRLKLDAFAGASYPEGDYGVYRGGAMAYFSTPGPGSFFAQAGLLEWQPPDDLDVDDLFFLFEPRLRFSRFGMIFTFFSHPASYRQEDSDLARRMDVNLRLQLEDLVNGLLTTGVESTFEIDPDADDKTVARTGPLVELNAAGVQWLFKLNAQVFPYEHLEGLEAVFAARTSF